jgi:hypothetical protein
VRSVTPVRQHSPWHRSPSRTTGRRERSLRHHDEIDVERERVIEQATMVTNFPVLTKVNYPDWSALMRVMLQERGLWLTVSVGTDDYTEDRMALEVLTKAVQPELMGTIARRSTTSVCTSTASSRNWQFSAPPTLRMRLLGVSCKHSRQGSTKSLLPLRHCLIWPTCR